SVCVFSSGILCQRPSNKTTSKPKQPPPAHVFTILGSPGESDDSPKGLTAAQQKRWDSFIKVWDTVNTSYFDTTFNGLDWKKIKAEFRPRVLALKNDDELCLVLSVMVGRLNKSNFVIVLGV